MSGQRGWAGGPGGCARRRRAMECAEIWRIGCLPWWTWGVRSTASARRAAPRGPRRLWARSRDVRPQRRTASARPDITCPARAHVCERAKCTTRDMTSRYDTISATLVRAISPGSRMRGPSTKATAPRRQRHPIFGLRDARPLHGGPHATRVRGQAYGPSRPGHHGHHTRTAPRPPPASPRPGAPCACGGLYTTTFTPREARGGGPAPGTRHRRRRSRTPAPAAPLASGRSNC